MKSSRLEKDKKKKKKEDNISKNVRNLSRLKKKSMTLYLKM